MIITTITWELILGIAGGIVVIYNASKVILGAISPITKIKDKINKHDELLDNDNKRLNSIEKTNQMMCKSMLALLDHEITGNSIEKLKKVKTEMQDFLVER